MPRGVYERQGTPTVSAERAASEKVGQPNHRTTPAPVDERAGANMTYVAMKPMKVNGVKVKPGDLVAEAATWRNLHNYISTGYLAVVSQ